MNGELRLPLFWEDIMKWTDVDCLEEAVEWYAGLIDFLDEHVASLDVLIEMYEGEE